MTEEIPPIVLAGRKARRARWPRLFAGLDALAKETGQDVETLFAAAIGGDPGDAAVDALEAEAASPAACRRMATEARKEKGRPDGEAGPLRRALRKAVECSVPGVGVRR